MTPTDAGKLVRRELEELYIMRKGWSGMQALNTTLTQENRFLRGMQRRVAQWVVETLSDESEATGMSPLDNKHERCLRFIEEALELAQAVGCSREILHRLVDYVMDRPVGHLPQEVGGAMVTIYALSAACDVDAATECMREVERIETPAIREKVRRRQAEKRQALVTNSGAT